MSSITLQPSFPEFEVTKRDRTMKGMMKHGDARETAVVQHLGMGGLLYYALTFMSIETS